MVSSSSPTSYAYAILSASAFASYQSATEATPKSSEMTSPPKHSEKTPPPKVSDSSPPTKGSEPTPPSNNPVDAITEGEE